MKELQQYDGNQVVSWDECGWKPKKVAAPAKVLKLSQAMRIGAAIRPQSKGRAFENGSSCAWGAAWEGSGGQYDENLGYSGIATELTRRFSAGYAYGNGKWSIAEMNDNGMSREQIADFLEGKGL